MPSVSLPRGEGRPAAPEAVTRSPIYSHFGETLAGMATVRSFGAQAHMAERNYRGASRGGNPPPTVGPGGGGAGGESAALTEIHNWFSAISPQSKGSNKRAK